MCISHPGREGRHIMFNLVYNTRYNLYVVLFTLYVYAYYCIRTSSSLENCLRFADIPNNIIIPAGSFKTPCGNIITEVYRVHK